MDGGDDDDDEINNLLKVWMVAIASLTYCYLISSKIQRGITRLLFLLPVISLFTILPLTLSSFHLTAITSFFIVWLANFKLLLFAFHQGPLSSPTNLFHFILLATLPIKTKPTVPPRHINPKKSKTNTSPPQNTKPILLVTKVVILVLLFQLYDYKQYLSHHTLLGIYCCHLYLELEMVLALCATPARFLGLELEPQFNEPYLTTSLQDLWGRRWNLMVTSILRPTVYHPIRCISIRMAGKQGAQLLGVIATFLVSGLMHELIYYYVLRAPPTWEVTCFFVLQGVCVAIEIVIKKMVAGRWRLHRVVSGLLTLGFVAATGFWLFFPQFLRNKVDQKALGELAVLVDFVKSIVKHKF